MAGCQQRGEKQLFLEMGIIKKMPTGKIFLTFAELKKAVNSSWNSLVSCILEFQEK